MYAHALSCVSTSDVTCVVADVSNTMLRNKQQNSAEAC